MARPQKNNADYFPHSAHQRNDRRVKAVISKFKQEGYGIFNCMLEILTESEANAIPYNTTELMLIAGDLNIDISLLTEVLEYCVVLNLFQVNQTCLHSKELDINLAPVYEKRKKAKEVSKTQKRTNGKFTTETIESTVVSVTETPQSKVEYSKVNKNKENNSIKEKPLYADLTEIESVKTIEYCLFTLQRNYDAKRISELWKGFLINAKEFYVSRHEKINHFRNWIKTQPYEKTDKHINNISSSAPLQILNA